ncbi:MAG: LysR family transcriptional regulator [Elusimicrobia bacterium]|nr:LysR family transcriptional regulator [Elusimicrobiota bacterium]
MKGSRLHLDLFKVFCDLAETANFSRTAARNNLTQSAVSQQITFLERHFGRRLVERDKKAFSLTEPGQVLLDGCRRILETHREVVAGIRHPRRLSGSVRVETIYSVGLHCLAPKVRSFLQSHPEVNLHVAYRRSDDIYSDVLLGACDLGIVAYPWPHPRIRIIPLKRERLVLACPPADPLAKKRRVRVQDLAGRNFIAFEKDIPTRRAIDAILRRAKVSVKVVQELDNVETIMSSVEVGLGVSILPEETIARDIGSGHLAGVAFSDGPFYRPTGVILKRGRILSRSSLEFLRALSKR